METASRLNKTRKFEKTLDIIYGEDFDLPFVTKHGFQPAYEEIGSNHGKQHLYWTKCRTFDKNHIDINVIDHFNLTLSVPLIVDVWNRLCDDFHLPFLTKRRFHVNYEEVDSKHGKQHLVGTENLQIIILALLSILP